MYLSSLLGIIKKTITKSPFYSHSNAISGRLCADHVHTKRCVDPQLGIHLHIGANSQLGPFIQLRMQNAVLCWLVLHAQAEMRNLARADFD